MHMNHAMTALSPQVSLNPQSMFIHRKIYDTRGALNGKLKGQPMVCMLKHKKVLMFDIATPKDVLTGSTRWDEAVCAAPCSIRGARKGVLLHAVLFSVKTQKRITSVYPEGLKEGKKETLHSIPAPKAES